MGEKKINTVHTARTIMFSELEKVMNFSVESDNYVESMKNNVFGKKSHDGIKKTTTFLTQLYNFDIESNKFKAFKYFWINTDEGEKPLIAFLYSINNDEVLAESIEVLKSTTVGDKAAVTSFENVLEKYHPNQYTENTRKSMAQNIASSWKQAGFIVGKVKNIRKQPEISYRVACFAFFLAYLNGDRGDFIWNSTVVNALCSYESKLRELAIQCAMKDMMQYQYAGSVTAISFTNLLNKIGINGDTN
jgi:hypothetical protein